jgi:hypothetical protein
MDQLEGARRLGREAVQRLASVGRREFMGVELGPFIRGLNDLHVDEDSKAIPLIALQ